MQNDIVAVGDVWDSDNHPRVDTQHIYGQVKLGTLVDDYLEDTFKMTFKAHDPTFDARATMLLYLRRHPYEGRDNFRDPTPKAEDFPALGAAAKL